MANRIVIVDVWNLFVHCNMQCYRCHQQLHIIVVLMMCPWQPVGSCLGMGPTAYLTDIATLLYLLSLT